MKSILSYSMFILMFNHYVVLMKNEIDSLCEELLEHLKKIATFYNLELEE